MAIKKSELFYISQLSANSVAAFCRRNVSRIFQFSRDCHSKRNMKYSEIFFLIFCIANLWLSDAQSNSENYSCNATSSYCVLKKFETSDNFQSFLSRNSEVYHSTNGYNQRSSMSYFMNIELKDDLKISKIPSLLFQRFSAMKKLIGSKMGLQELKSDDFKYAEKLKSLILSYNDIKELENVQFMYLKSVEEIDLMYNKISFIHDGAFDKVGVNLTKIDLSFNQIAIFKEDYLWPIFNALETKWINPRLTLYLENNILSEWVASDKNSSSTVVVTMDLSDNNLKKFTLRNFKVHTLYLVNNQIEDFEVNFDKIDASRNKLKKLNISIDCTSVVASENQISEITIPSANSSKLTKFDVSNNKLKPSQTFLDFLKRQTKMTSLNLSNNFFGVFALDYFADMENLQELSLSNTGITEIPFGLFSHVEDLQFLNLSRNNLKEIDFHVFSSLRNLTSLDISGNSLSNIDEYDKLKEILPKLQNIGLEGKFNTKFKFLDYFNRL